jgi:hypothetical protein
MSAFGGKADMGRRTVLIVSPLLTQADKIEVKSRSAAVPAASCADTASIQNNSGRPQGLGGPSAAA